MTKKIIYVLCFLFFITLSVKLPGVYAQAASGGAPSKEFDVCYYKETGFTTVDKPCSADFDCVRQTQRYTDTSTKVSITKEFGRCRKKGTYSQLPLQSKCYEEDVNKKITLFESCSQNVMCDIDQPKASHVGSKEIVRTGRCTISNGSCGMLIDKCTPGIINGQGSCCDGNECFSQNLVNAYRCRRVQCMEVGGECGGVLDFPCCSPESVCLNSKCVKKDTSTLANNAIPGRNCGDGRSSETKKCCYDNKRSKNSLKDNVKSSLGRHCILLVCTDDIVDYAFNILTYPSMGAKLVETYESMNNFKVEACKVGDPYIGGTLVTSEADWSNPDCYCNSSSGTQVCKSYLANNPSELQSCISCFNGVSPYNAPGVWTGIGCVYTNLSDFISKTLFGIGIGFAGIIAFFCILYAGYTLQTSAGNPEKIKKAQEMLTSCIIGLLLIIFSVFILRVIGVDILRVPGFK